MMNFGFCDVHRRREIVPVDRRRDADQRANPIVLRAFHQRDIRAEGKPRRPQVDARVLRRHEIDRGSKVIDFAAPFVPRARASTNAAEVEAQHRTPDSRQRLCPLKHHLCMHRPALRRQRVREDHGRARVAGWLLDQHF